MKDRKTVFMSIPCFNEEDNVIPLCEDVINLFETKLQQYDYMIQFIDNNSEDRTQERIFQLCSKYPFVRAIFNAKNFKGNSAIYGLLQTQGDCAIYLSADFQDPIELIPQFLEKWEEGNLIVAAIKTKSKENIFKYMIRNRYYKIMKRFSDIEFIEQFCNFGLYDKHFLDIIRELKNPNYSIRGNVAQYGYNICYLEYEQQERRSGKSKYNFWKLLDIAITNFIDYTDIILKAATVMGVFFSVLFSLISIVFLILKVFHWSEYPMGISPILIGMFFTSSINMFLLGIIGEYILAVRRKVTDSPLVIEKGRLNFLDQTKVDEE